MKKTFKACASNGKRYELELPETFPVNFKEFLRIVVGGIIASARTETDRIRFVRNFLVWAGSTTDQANNILAKWRSSLQWQEMEFRFRANNFAEWASGMLHRRAVAARKKVKKPFGKESESPKVKQARHKNSSSRARHSPSRKNKPTSKVLTLR